MTIESGGLPPRKQKAYLWGGATLVVLGAVGTLLNLTLPVPEYQKVGWFLVGFFWIGGVAGVAAARGAIPAGGKVVEYGEALVVAGVLAIAIRGAVVQAFKIPSGSMLPTLLIGDHLLVTKFLYGVRIPYTDIRLLRLRGPRRGDIAVFAFPGDDSKDFIKRIIGEPGDTVEVREKKVYINGEPMADPWGNWADARVLPPAAGKRDFFGPVTVPEGMYFVMGDNRDRSLDSRFWGFVEDARIRGKAFILYWSWDSENTRPRLRRMGNLLH
jgi:signal peptidase I